MDTRVWAGEGGRLDGGCRHRRSAATATVVAAVVVAVVAGVAVTAASLRGTPMTAGGPAAAPVGPLSPVVRAAAEGAPPSEGAPATANATADPITEAWLAALLGRAAAALPPLPSADLFLTATGLFTLHAGVGLAAGQVLVEVAAADLGVPFALSAEFSALDAAAQGLIRRVDLTALSADRVFALRLAPGTEPPTLELYRPPLYERSVDPDSVPGRQALGGISGTILQSFAARPVGDGRLLFDAGPWVAAGFHLPGLAAVPPRFVGATAHPRSVTMRVRVAGGDGIGGTLVVTVVGLPRQRMEPRPLDDRVGFFATEFSWVDDYTAVRPAAGGAYINKWDLTKNPVLRYYVDPSVPPSFWPAVVDGILRWNPAFEAAGYRRPVLRAVVPTDADWPADYAADDARFNTISFVPGNQELALGAPKVDPRTGETLNADIVLKDNMVRGWATTYRLWYASDRDERASSRAASAAGRPVPGSEEDFVYQQLADTTAHEVGHTLGLRHNWRGSAGIPWEQLTNETYVSIHGLSTSVMDYLPSEPLPTRNGRPQRYFATPVVGAYDIAAIRYGYARWRSEADARAFAESVAASGLALAVDGDQEADALAQQFDLSATPLEWYRHNVATVRRQLRRLGRTTGRAASTTSAADRTAAATELLSSGVRSVRLAAVLVGAAIPHRGRTRGAPAVSLLDAATEAAAAGWVLAQLHPADGLLSAATVAAVAPHLLVKGGADCSDSPACLRRAPPPLATLLHAAREEVLATLLAPSRLARLTANAAARPRRLSVAALLEAVSETLVGPRWAGLAPPAAVTAGSLFQEEATARWVAALTALASGSAANETAQQPAAVGLAAAGELSRIATAVAAAVAAAPGSAHLRGLRLATAAFALA